MRSHNPQPSVAVVLCTYNGSTHLDTQLESLVAQTWPIALYAFDDASTDDTVEEYWMKGTTTLHYVIRMICGSRLE